MGWNIHPTQIGSVKRRKTPPTYDFIEHCIRRGKAFSIGDDGYFIVAPSDSLMPGFVIELALPEKALIEEYKSLSYELIERSAGMLWFDSSDLDAFDFAWRLRLPLRAASPLFTWSDEARLPKSSDAGLHVRDGSDQDKLVVRQLLTGFSQHRGGKASADVVDFHFDRNQIRILESNGEVVGAAVLEEQPEGFVALTVAIEDKWRNRGFATQFAGILGKELADRGKTMVAGMAHDVPESLRAALSLKMRLVKQSFTGQMGSF